MRYELNDYEWRLIKPMLPNKPRGVPRVDALPFQALSLLDLRRGRAERA
jgi:transposase